MQLLKPLSGAITPSSSSLDECLPGCGEDAPTSFVGRLGCQGHAHIIHHEGALTLHRQSALLLNVLGNVHREPYAAIGSCEGLAAGDEFRVAPDEIVSAVKAVIAAS